MRAREIKAPFELFPHQVEAIAKAKGMRGFMFLMDMGLGKTLTALEECKIHGPNLVICVAPAGVHIAWAKDSVYKYYSDFYDFIGYYQRSHIISLKDIPIEKSRKIFISINYEMFKSPHLQFIMSLLKQYPSTSLLIVDESHRIKNPTSLIAKKVLTMSKLFKHVRLLTGTPVGQGHQDLYQQLRVAMGNAFPWRYFSAFVNTFCRLGGFKNKQIVESINHEKLRIIMNPFCFIAKKEDCIKLPDKLYKTSYIDMSKSTADLYKRAKRNAILIDKKDMTQAINQLNLLRNLTSGLLDGKHIYSRIEDNPKLSELKRIIDLHKNKQAIIFSSFVAEGELISKFLNAPFYHGELQPREKERILSEYKTGVSKIIVATVQSLGTGFDLHMTNVIVYFSNQYSFLLRTQSEDRAHRIGTKETVFIYDLVLNETVDERIHLCLQKKENIADLILKDGFKNFVK